MKNNNYMKNNYRKGWALITKKVGHKKVRAEGKKAARLADK